MAIKNIVCFLVLILSLSCQKPASRMPASDIVASEQVIQAAFEIQKIGDVASGAPSWSSVKSSFQSNLRGLDHVTGVDNLVVEVANEALPEGVAARLVPDITPDGKFVLKIIHNGDDAGAQLVLDKVANRLGDKKILQTFYDFFEWSYNIRAGDIEAIAAFHQVKTEAFAQIDTNATAQLALVRESMQEQSDEFSELAKQISRNRKQAEQARKSILSEIDRAGEGEQLKGLVAAGKREEVAELLEKYIPREQMAPFERNFWDQMLEVIRNPVPIKDRILVFRGIDEDMVYGALSEAGKELSKDEAIASSRGFMMSSMMTKNQGTWNRRLRSLQTMNDKFLGQNHATSSSEWTKHFRISTFFKQHSRNPQGSPFLSFTPKISVASQFGAKRTAAYLVDPRALLANTTTGYISEFEFLTTLVTFPDELMDVYDRELHGEMDNAARKARFLEKTRSKMVSEYGEVEGEQAYNRIKTTFDHFNDFNDVAQLETNVKKQGFFSKVVSWFKKKPATPVDAPVDHGAKSCTYVLKFLWNI